MGERLTPRAWQAGGLPRCARRDVGEEGGRCAGMGERVGTRTGSAVRGGDCHLAVQVRWWQKAGSQGPERGRTVRPKEADRWPRA